MEDPSKSIEISSNVRLLLGEIEMRFIRAQGSGGQNINKVSSAVHLRFNIKTSSLPMFYKERLLKLDDSRITLDGIIVIKAQKFRTQEKNREDALQRLRDMIRSAGVTKKKRRSTKPTRSSQEKRVNRKKQRGQIKNLRGRISD